MPRPRVDYRTTSKATYQKFLEAHPTIKITYKKWCEVIRCFNEGFRDYVLETGDRCKLPFGFGDISISKKITKRFKTVDGQERIALPIDWKRTKEKGKRVYIFNDHTDGYRFRWYWFKDNLRLKGAKYLVFKPSRVSSRKLAEYKKESLLPTLVQRMETTIDTLLDLLIANGGSIVSSNDCSLLELALARSCGRFWVDDDGMGFVYRPPIKIVDKHDTLL